MNTTVRNIRDGTYDPANPQHVYIGRRNARYRLAGSEWANPVRLKRESERPAMLEQYRRYLGEERPDLLERVPELAGKTLYCWCKPPDGFQGRLLCHGQVLAGIAGGIAPETVE